MSTDRLLLPPELDPLEVVVAPDLCEGVGPLPLRAQAAVQGEALGAVPLLWGDRSWIVEPPWSS